MFIWGAGPAVPGTSGTAAGAAADASRLRAGVGAVVTTTDSRLSEREVFVVGGRSPAFGLGVSATTGGEAGVGGGVW